MFLELLVLLAAALRADSPVRSHAEAVWWCANLEYCTDWRSANEWLNQLRAEPGSETKMRLAYGLWGNGLRRLDFWLMTASDQPFAGSRALFRAFPHTGNVSEPSHPWKGAMAEEIARRPEKIRLWLHFQRYWMGTKAGSQQYLDSVRRTFTGTWVEKHEGSPHFMLSLEKAFGFCGRFDLIRGLNPKNWRERYAAWTVWLDENEPCLRFDGEVGQFVVDEQAKRNGRALPPDAREITAALDPTPDWEPGLVELDDDPFRQALRLVRAKSVEEGLQPGTADCYRAEARHLCEALGQVLLRDDAVVWWFALWIEPGAEERLREASRQVGRGNQLLDYWVLATRDQLGHRHGSQLREALIEEVARRASEDPQVARRYVHLQRYRDRNRDKGLLNYSHFRAFGDRGLFERQLEVYHRLAAFPTTTRWRLLQAMSLSGHDELIRGIAPVNLTGRLNAWADWCRENSGYLRFDEQRGHLVVDEEAKRAGKKIPLVIPPADVPLPDWRGPLPVLERPRRPARPKLQAAWRERLDAWRAWSPSQRPKQPPLQASR